MNTRRQRIHARTKKIRKFVDTFSAKHPQWKIEEVINKTAEAFDLAPRTIEAILKGEGSYKTDV